jgi:hypothetical protein
MNSKKILAISMIAILLSIIAISGNAIINNYFNNTTICLNCSQGIPGINGTNGTNFSSDNVCDATYCVYNNSGNTLIKNGITGNIVFNGTSDISSFIQINYQDRQTIELKNTSVYMDSVTWKNNSKWMGYENSTINTLTGINGTGINNIEITGLNIIGSSTSDMGLLRFNTSSNIHIENNKLYPDNGRAVYISNSNQSYIMNNDMYNSTTYEQIVISGNGAIVENNKFTNTRNAMALLTSGSLSNAWVSKNIFTSTQLSYAAFSLEAYAEFPGVGIAYDNIHFFNNMVNGAPVITINRGFNSSDNNIFIENNIINTDNRTAIVIDSNIENIQINKNNITTNSTYSVYINPIEYRHNMMLGSITNNYILNTKSNGTGIITYNGTYDINHNKKIDAYQPIYMYDTFESDISSNAMNITGNGVGITLSSQFGVLNELNTIKNNVINGNLGSKAILLLTTKTTTTSDNTFIGMSSPIGATASTRNSYLQNRGASPFDYGDCSIISWFSGGGSNIVPKPGDQCTNLTTEHRLIWNGTAWLNISTENDIYNNNIGIINNVTQLQSNVSYLNNNKVNKSGDIMTNTLNIYSPDTYMGVYAYSENYHGMHGQSNTSVGVYGQSNKSFGIWGTSNTSYGIVGHSVDNIGVYGDSDNNIGIYGKSTNSTGLKGDSVNGIGLAGSSVNNFGLSGISLNSVGLYGSSTTSTGVYGNTVDTTGVKGESINSVGVRAISTNDYGLSASSLYTYGKIFAPVITNSGQTNFLCYNSGTGEITYYPSTCIISTESLKTNISIISTSLTTKFMNLAPITYNLNTNPSLEYGLSAQNVNIQFPELVSYNVLYDTTINKTTGIVTKTNPHRGEIAGVKYENMIAILTKVIQEQQTTIQVQQTTINNICRNQPSLCQ